MKHVLFFPLLMLFALTQFAIAQVWNPTVLWQREGEDDSSRYGYQIIPLGDQNEDGYDDWAVFAYGWGPAGSPLEGKVEFFYGNGTLSLDSQPELYRTIVAADSIQNLWWLLGFGDLNADGYQDYCIIANPLNWQDGWIHYFYYGGPDDDGLPDLVLQPQIGAVYQPMGDLNTDGYSDLLLIEAMWEYWSLGFWGGIQFDTIPDWDPGRCLFPQQLGDFNGDGILDLAASEEYYDTLFIFQGGTNPSTIPAFQMPVEYPHFGFVGHVNDDEFDDICLSRPGAGWIYTGSTNSQAEFIGEYAFPCGSGEGEGGPSSVQAAGDISGDGFGDVILSTDYCIDNWWGLATVYLGGTSLPENPLLTIEGGDYGKPKGSVT